VRKYVGCSWHGNTVYANRLKLSKITKIIKHKYDYQVAPGLIYNINKVTRGNDFRLSKNRSHYDLRKFSFTNS